MNSMLRSIEEECYNPMLAFSFVLSIHMYSSKKKIYCQSFKIMGMAKGWLIFPTRKSPFLRF